MRPEPQAVVRSTLPKAKASAAALVRAPMHDAAGTATSAARSAGARPLDGVFVVAISVCHSQFFWNYGDETCAITEGSTSGNAAASWRDELKAINGILFVGNISLGNGQVTRARLVRNPERCLPESLAPLTTKNRIAMLTGDGAG